jgi:uncharacterized protein YxjI
MRYPLDLRFKVIALASQIYVSDADGNQVFYIKQKLFKLKENIEIFSDSSKTMKLYTVKADRIIDFSPEFTLYDQNESAIGSVKRLGRKSIWKSTYEVKVGNMVQLTVKEHDPWVKVADALVSEIPIIGLISGYILHPRYDVTDANGQVVGNLEKMPAFLEGKYRLDGSATNFDDNAHRTFAALMMVVVLRERLRG